MGVRAHPPRWRAGPVLLNGHTLRWDKPLLQRCGLDDTSLNSISDEPGSISKGATDHFPELAGVPWYPAIGDGAASNLGSGATAPGFAAINVGTSAALRVVVAKKTSARQPLAPFGLFSYRIDSHRRLLGGAVSNAGNLRAWGVARIEASRREGDRETSPQSVQAGGQIDSAAVLDRRACANLAGGAAVSRDRYHPGDERARSPADASGSDLSSAGADRRGDRKKRATKAGLCCLRRNSAFAERRATTGGCFGAARLCLDRAGSFVAWRSLFCARKAGY